MEKIHIITRCTRPNNLLVLRDSILNNINNEIIFTWTICFDSRILKDIDVELLAELQNNSTFISKIDFRYLKGDYWGLSQLNDIILSFEDGWVYHLDDDNILHENFTSTLLRKFDSQKEVIVFSQYVGGKDFSRLEIRDAKPKNMKVSKVDLAQWLVKASFHKDGYLYGSGYTADGELIEKAFKEKREKFLFINEVLSYYNYLQKDRTANVPKILYIGDNQPIIKTSNIAEWEANELNVKYTINDNNIVEDLVSFKPDCIITNNDNGWEKYPNMASMPISFRKKWIHTTSNDLDYLGDIGYNTSMFNILEDANLKDEELISFITPVYNTGDKIITTYNSLVEQTYNNWEWVLVNDSTDGGKTLKIIESISKKDPRVVIYDFREKSGGNIGEAKYRGFMLAKGYLLVELDHDDILVSDCAEQLYNASKKHPECGFFYNDTAELTENFESMRYPDGFAFGYGKYRQDTYKGIKIDTIAQQNINPKTIRHIVGVPNHVRAWKRDVYLKIGGHSRGLAIADDYELIVRTFLETKFCGIPKLGYIQFIYNNNNGRNTHDLSRADIQRRVRTIADYYNERINKRFIELGLEDWAYNQNPTNPLLTESRFGEQENAANIIYTEND
jgi:glycosyltransferase involved in cell wall biosynthesis